ncbi:Zinc-type alcohol dehydrogenase-like protein [Olavius algarvensis Delta 1 endosymbiont]|nr:Zinc-type alcohol dehydrogenase-like protein [Olavius algarvensis Delta 1 endosymbiont]
MKAIGFYQYLPVENPESLVAVEVPTPEPDGRDLLVRVKAVSVNPVDVKVRSRLKTVEEQPKIIGWDVAGVVESTGSDVSLFKAGDEVYYAGDITRPGCNSEFHLVDERIVGRRPASLSFEQAAAMPLTTITAWEALFDRLGVEKAIPSGQDRKSVLVIGGAGGVGSIAIQLAKKVAGCRVVATASRDDTAAWCRKLGADEIINHHKPFAEEFKRIGSDEVDYILCFNSTEKHIQNMADVIKPQGRICTIVETKDSQPVNISIFQAKSVGFMWELMFTRPMFKTPDMQAQHDLLNEAARLLDEGVLATTMTENYGTLTADNLRKAHGKLESGSMIGKLVLSGIE